MSFTTNKQNFNDSLHKQAYELGIGFSGTISLKQGTLYKNITHLTVSALHV